MLPRPKTLGADTVFYMDVAITGAFTLELLINIFAHSRHMCTNCLFFREKNNWFDGSIVVISITSVHERRDARAGEREWVVEIAKRTSPSVLSCRHKQMYVRQLRRGEGADWL